jgi:hypothetical protein
MNNYTIDAFKVLNRIEHQIQHAWRKANLVDKALTRTETKAYNQMFNRLIHNDQLFIELEFSRGVKIPGENNPPITSH